MSRKIKILNRLNVFECKQRNVKWSHGQRWEGEIKRQSSFGYSNYSTEFIGTWRTQWVWLSHALSTLLYITLTRRIPSFPFLSILCSPSFHSLPTNCASVSVLVCWHVPQRKTNRAWQSENKQSADVCVGTVSEIMLRRRHFSLILFFFSSFHIKYAEKKGKKQAWVRLERMISVMAWTNFHYLKSRKYHILKNKQKRFSSSSPFWLAVLLWEGHFFLWCVCGILGCLPLLVCSDLKELHDLNKMQIR